MDIEDLEPQKKPPALKPLETLSIEELKDYIVSLESEISRARQMIAAKEKARSGADSVFRR